MKNQTVDTDILVIGGGPAGFAFAIHAADLIKAANLPFKIILVEKSNALGNHSLSGAVINPTPLRELLPDIEQKDMPFDTPVTGEEIFFFTRKGSFLLPFIPPQMNNHGNVIATLGKVARWLGEIADKKGVQVFTGFSGHELIYENDKVVGVRIGASGIDKHGKAMENYQPPA